MQLSISTLTSIRYPVSVMCKFFEVSRNGYYDFVKRMDEPEKDAEVAEKDQGMSDLHGQNLRLQTQLKITDSQKYYAKSENSADNYETAWFVARKSPSQEVGKFCTSGT